MSLAQVDIALASAGIAGDWVTVDQVETLGPTKGAYALVLELTGALRLDINKFAGSILEPGWYVYVGSARGPGGLKARLRRHFQKAKPLHWHVDHLTTAALPNRALAVPLGDECVLLAALLDQPELNVPLPGFGSTDCKRCPSHLLRLG